MGGGKGGLTGMFLEHYLLFAAIWLGCYWQTQLAKLVNYYIGTAFIATGYSSRW